MPSLHEHPGYDLPAPRDSRVLAGMLNGIALAIPIWATIGLIAWGCYLLARWLG